MHLDDMILRRMQDLDRRLKAVEHIERPTSAHAVDDGIIGEAALAEASVTAPKIATGAVESAALGTGSVTPLKVQKLVYLLARSTAVVNVVNTNLETQVFSTTIPGGTLNTDDAVRLEMRAVYFNNTGAGQTVRVKVTYGATVIYNDVSAAFAASATGKRNYRVDVGLRALYATNAQHADGLTIASALVTTPGESTSTSGQRDAEHDAVAEDSTQDKALTVSITLGSTSASLSLSVKTVEVFHIKG